MFHLFERFGIELEYMIVNRDTLQVSPITDLVLKKVNGDFTNEVTMDDIAWSNELVLHVIELKTAEPALTINNYGSIFQKNIAKINDLLLEHNAVLMPGPMHPLMDPVKEMRLWPHDYNPIYTTFDRIFSCKGHGWANLQSMHINLPFADDEEFARLHTAIRLILPIIPALSAGSPIADGKVTGFHDTRMEVYRTNSQKIPSIAGKVIPEAVFSESEYQEKILQPIYRDLNDLDPEKILQEEWVNARGAIARFERNTIEIRIIDVQENPSADLAIASAVIDIIKVLIQEDLSSFKDQKKAVHESLVSIFQKTIKTGEKTIIDDEKFLRLFGLKGKSYKAGEIWKEIISAICKNNNQTFISENYNPLETILNKGSLATRILSKTGLQPSRESIESTFQHLSDCLSNGSLLV